MLGSGAHLSSDDKCHVCWSRQWAKWQPPASLEEWEADAQLARDPESQPVPSPRLEELVLSKRVAREERPSHLDREAHEAERALEEEGLLRVERADGQNE